MIYFVQCLWATPGDDDLLQIPGMGDLGGRRRLSGGGEELVPGKGGLEEDGANPHQEGGSPTCVCFFFKKAMVLAVLLFGSET